MKYFYCIILAIPFFIVACSSNDDSILDKNDDLNQFEGVQNDQAERVVVAEGGYLSFRDQESYKQISDLLDNMTDEEFIAWENDLGFQSAQTYLSNVYAQIELIETEEDFELIKESYSSKLVFDDQGDIRLPFYATAWNRVLNVDGVMRIGTNLYKFEKDRECIISDGDCNDLKNLSAISSDSSKVQLFYPAKEMNNELLKSLQWGSLSGATIYSSDEKSRLKYDFQMVSFNFTGYAFSTTQYTEAGFELKLRLDQKRKGWLGRWRMNETVYEMRNLGYHIEYDEPSRYINTYVNGQFAGRRKIGGDHVDDTDSGIDYTSSRTNQGKTFSLYYYYFVDQYDWTHVEPEIDYVNFSFWSGGIGYDNRITINYSNK